METSRTPIFRRYEVVEKIGSGGMGTVYKARDTHLNRVVALKVLPPGLQEDDDAVERFKREARALARLKHPRVASVYDAHVEGGFPHLVMELVNGETLERLLKTRRSLTAEETARIGIDISEALEHIHAHRIVHRDVKSSNIIMEPRIGAVLADFGIALEASLPRISQGALGTPEYMSPEQAEGRDLDGRSDLYSVGVVLFECLTGRTPFRRDGESLASLMDLMKRITAESIPPIRELKPETPTWMADVVARCLEKDPDRRFASAVELASALREGLREAGTALLSDPDEQVAAIPDVKKGRRRRFDYSGSLKGAPKNARKLDDIEALDAEEYAKLQELRGGAAGDLQNERSDAQNGERNGLPDGERSDLRDGERSDAPDGERSDSQDGARSGSRNGERSDSQNDARSNLQDGAGLILRDVPANHSHDGGDGAPLHSVNGDAAGDEKDLLKRREMMVITHLRPVQAVAFDHDGKRLASASDDGVVRIWQVADGKLLHAFDEHEGSVSSVAFSPDGRHVASGDIFGKICLWDAATGRLIRTIDGLTALIMALAFSPDGKTLASGGADRAVRLWDVRTGHLADTVGRHLGYVLSASFSRDGGRIATSGSDGQVIVWDLGRKVLAAALNAHKGWAVSVDFSPDGQKLVSGGSDHRVKIWNASKGTLIHEMTGHTGGVMATAFSPSGTIVASAGRDRMVRLWDMRSGRCVSRLSGHAGAVTALSFSPSGRHLAAGSDDRTARIWFLDRKTFGSRRALKRMIGWMTIGVLALASVAGPLDLSRMDVGSAWGDVKEVLPKLSGAALEGTFLSRNKSEGSQTVTEEPARASITPPQRRAPERPSSQARDVQEHGAEQGTDRTEPSNNDPQSSGLNPPSSTDSAADNEPPTTKNPPEKASDLRESASRAGEKASGSRPPSSDPGSDTVTKAPKQTFHPLYGGGDLLDERQGWTILVGSLRSLRGARWLVSHYRDLGLRSGVLAVPSGGNWDYLVGVGQFENRRDAEKAVSTLRGRELPFRVQIERLRWEYMTAER